MEFNFQANQFKTGMVKMPGLCEMVRFIPGKEYFRSDGVVPPPMKQHIAKLPERIRQVFASASFEEKGGVNIGIGNGNDIGYYMVVDDISPRLNQFNLAHESAEILHRAGKRRSLVNCFKRWGFDVDLEKLSTHEIGVVGGFIGATIDRYNIDDLIKKQDPEGWELIQRLGLPQNRTRYGR